MKFREKDHKYFVRLERGEEIVSTLKKFCEEQKIHSGFIAGIGATDSVTLGFFNPQEQSYNEETINEDMEITSLMGNVSLKDGSVHIHLHMNASSSDYNTIGGHLIASTISLTCELCVSKFDEKVERTFDSELGISLLNL